MKRKQIYIEEEQERELKRIARERGVPEAVLIREALGDYLRGCEFPVFERMEDTPLWGIVGLIDDPGVPADSSANLDHYLYGFPKKYRFSKDGKAVRIRRRGSVR